MIRILQRPFSCLPHQHKGFSLPEILVALVISLFLIAGVIQIFLGGRQTYRFHDALSRIQENGRFVVDKMARDIRMVGYQPTASTVVIGNAIRGTNNDQLTVSWSNDGSTLEYRKYLLKTGASGQSALFLNVTQAAAAADDQELVEGVERMQISYGEDMNSDRVADSYKVAGDVTNWDNVVSVRIELLLASLETNIVATNQAVIFPPIGSVNSPTTPVTVPDRRLSQIFSTTVALRNRLN